MPKTKRVVEARATAKMEAPLDTSSESEDETSSNETLAAIEGVIEGVHRVRKKINKMEESMTPNDGQWTVRSEVGEVAAQVTTEQIFIPARPADVLDPASLTLEDFEWQTTTPDDRVPPMMRQLRKIGKAAREMLSMAPAEWTPYSFLKGDAITPSWGR